MILTTDIDQKRSDFPLLQDKMNGKPIVFLDSAASSQKPQVVIDAISQYYEHDHANVHRGVYELSQRATDAFEHGRKVVKDFINAPSTEEIIFTKGATEGINLVASSFSQKFLNQGDEIIISTMEHHSNIVPWQMACERHGASLKVIPIFEDGSLDHVAFRNLISNKTKIVSIAHISNAMGVINPVQDMIQLAHEVGAAVLIDGCQAAPHIKVDVVDLNADFYVFSGHKVYGPTGIGVLYGKRHWLDAMPPYQGGGEMIDQVSFEKTTYNVIPHKFEAGTPHISGVVGLGTALEYIMQIGHEAIIEHEQELLAYATNQLKSLSGLRIIGDLKNKTSVISFIVEGCHPYDLGTLLDKQGIAVRTGHHCAQPLMARFNIPGTVRASFSLYSNKQDIDALISALTRAIQMLS
jgi:cysteine desulfurase / selenocysteine lyase